MKGGNEGWIDERVGGDGAEEIVFLTNDGSLQTLNVLLLLKHHIVQFCFGCRQDDKRNKNEKISSRDLTLTIFITCVLFTPCYVPAFAKMY